MIKINKDLIDIPDSLKPSSDDYFSPPRRPSIQSRKTHQRRQEVIDKGEYTEIGIYNSRYRYQDIKAALHGLYNKKCAFCEQRSEVPQVEHFRPKSKYYWVAYSWDNLLLACSSCNTSKGKVFELAGREYVFKFDENQTYQTIHRSCVIMDQIELPLLVNPEVEDLVSELIFNVSGEVHSDNPRMNHTIKSFDLSRSDLCYQRKKLIDDFKKDIEAVLLENHDDIASQKIGIRTLIGQFRRKAQSPEDSFLAFRRYAIDWLGSLLKEVN